MADKLNGNGHDLSAAIELAGGTWGTGSGVELLRMSLEAAQAASAAQVQFHRITLHRQLAISEALAHVERAKEDFIAAMKDSNFKAAAEAQQRVARYTTILTNLGYYDGPTVSFPSLA
jgi:hypothetical protein